MVARPGGGHGAQSPLEIIAIPVVLGGLIAVGVLWGIGVVIGSILGSNLPGTTVGDSVLTMLAAFPDIGDAWEPAIPSVLVWASAIAVTGMVAPFIWRMLHAGRLREDGAQWATRHQLRRAGLLVSNRSVPHAVAEAAEVEDAS